MTDFCWLVLESWGIERVSFIGIEEGGYGCWVSVVKEELCAFIGRVDESETGG